MDSDWINETVRVVMLHICRSVSRWVSCAVNGPARYCPQRRRFVAECRCCEASKRCTRSVSYTAISSLAISALVSAPNPPQFIYLTSVWLDSGAPSTAMCLNRGLRSPFAAHLCTFVYLISLDFFNFSNARSDDLKHRIPSQLVKSAAWTGLENLRKPKGTSRALYSSVLRSGFEGRLRGLCRTKSS